MEEQKNKNNNEKVVMRQELSDDDLDLATGGTSSSGKAFFNQNINPKDVKKELSKKQTTPQKGWWFF